MDENLIWLSQGPFNEVTIYGGYTINGYHFPSKALERSTQSNGVMLIAELLSYSSSRDRNPITSSVTYYGQLDEVEELQDGPSLKITMFKCIWFDEQTSMGFKKDKYGFSCINHSWERHKEEPFILASQAQQCFNVQDIFEENWYIVLRKPPWDLFDMPAQEFDNDDILSHLACNIDSTSQITNDEDVPWVREDVQGITVTFLQNHEDESE